MTPSDQHIPAQQHRAHGISPRLGDSAKREVRAPGEATLSRPSFLAGQTPDMHLYDDVQDGFRSIRPVQPDSTHPRGIPYEFL